MVFNEPPSPFYDMAKDLLNSWTLFKVRQGGGREGTLTAAERRGPWRVVWCHTGLVVVHACGVGGRTGSRTWTTSWRWRR